MLTKSFIALCLCLLVGPLTAANLVWESKESSIEMTPDQEVARATFKFTNAGEDPVRIARIKTSCGCTGSVVDRKRIEPGESSEIIGTFNKGNRQGVNTNRLQVFIDSEPDPVATLIMEVKVPSLIEAMPRVVYWNTRTSESPRRVQLNIDRRYVDEISKIEYDRKMLKVREEPSEDPENGGRLLFIEPIDYATPYRGHITIYGRGPGGRKVDTRIHAFVQP